MSVVEMNQLTKLYKNGRGIRGIDLNIEKGQCFGILGPNGSGKTTIMKLMTGLLHPSSGDIRIFGADPETNSEDILKKTGSLIEAPAFFPYLTASQNIKLVQRYYSLEAVPEALALLDRLGIGAYADEKAAKFSLGMKQRLGIAMTLAGNPELLILDEPCNGLDIEGRMDIKKLIQTEIKNGKTVLIASHIAEEIGQVCTDVAVMKEGSILAIAKVPDIIKHYGSIEEYYLWIIKERKGGDAS